MEASPAKVIHYFNGEKQNLIPLFQRKYTWGKDKWQTLWDDLIVQYELGDQEHSSHFMGAIVSVPARSVPVGVNKYLIIDGQQRLTTISILLCVLRDCLRDVDPNAASRIQEVYLINRYRPDEDTLKFVPTQVDRDVYKLIALDRLNEITDNNHKMLEAYKFFKKRITENLDSNEQKIDITRLSTTLEQSLQVVMINLSDEDDPYLIFESLNFKGEPLTQADLVRNYLLMCFRHSIAAGGEQDRIYNDYWKRIEISLKENLTEFLRHYIMRDGNDVKKGSIYTSIKANLKNLTAREVEQEVNTMLKFSAIYSKFIDPLLENKDSVQKRLINLNELKVTTSYPLLLRLFDSRANNTLNNDQLASCLQLIESFMVRRSICGVATNPLNKLFIQLCKSYPEQNHYEWLLSSLSSGTGRSRFPNDNELKTAFSSQAQYGRASTKFILHQLEKSFNHNEIVDLQTTTIEHVMPQTLSPEWVQLLQNDVNEHAAWLHTFGNLTLTGYNAELGNKPFEEKKELLNTTHIELNRWILKQDTWGLAEIVERSEFLFEKAKELWIAPIPV